MLNVYRRSNWFWDALGITNDAPEPVAPKVERLRTRPVEAALVNIYAARPRVWIGQVAGRDAPRLQLRVYL